MDTSIVDQVIEQLKVLPLDRQQRVLKFARTLADERPKGTSGRDFLQFAGLIPQEDLQVMSDAIEQDCEQVDLNEW
jgi:hypothetical protein